MNTAYGEPEFTLTRVTLPDGTPAPATAVPYPPLPARDIPPGVELVTLPTGARVLAYTQHPAPAHPVSPPPAAQSIPGWAKTTALLAPTVGGGAAAAGYGLSVAAPGLIAMSDALWAAVALVVAAPIAAAALIGALRKRGPENDVPQAPIVQNIHAHGLFGRASGTINHR